MILYRLTPWARRQLSPETREAIEAAEPRDLLVTLGRGTGGWTCRILSPRQPGTLGEAYQAGTIESAFRQAVADMEATVEHLPGPSMEFVTPEQNVERRP